MEGWGFFSDKSASFELLNDGKRVKREFTRVTAQPLLRLVYQLWLVMI